MSSFQILVQMVYYILIINSTSSTNTRCEEILSSTLNLNNDKRDYSYYYPSILCDTSLLTSFVTDHFDDKQEFDVLRDKINLPILLIIHGYTDNPHRFLSHWKWQEYAEEYGYIILAPKGGINDSNVPSWNAQSCCGYNLEHSIDDVSFIRELIYKFINDISIEFPFLDITLSNLILFITGHSNGSFFMDKLSWIYGNTNPEDINKGKHKGFPISITGVAPISAFIYDNKQFITNTMNGHNKVSIFYQHGDHDTGVDHRGCGCKNATCCCNIIQHSNICVSLKQAYNRWLQWNQHIDTINIVDRYKNNKTNKIRNCTFNKYDNNRYLTWICIWSGANHGVWNDKHVDVQVLKNKIIQFFMHSLCIKNNYKWNNNTNSCQCSNNDKKENIENTKIYYCTLRVSINSSITVSNSNLSGEEYEIEGNMLSAVSMNSSNSNLSVEEYVIEGNMLFDEMDSEIPSMQIVLVMVTLVSGVIALIIACCGVAKRQTLHR